MPFQGFNFIRNQNFTRDRNAGPPDHFISAEKVDDELTNIADGLTTTRAAAATADEKAGLARERAEKAETNAIETVRGNVDAPRNTLKKIVDWAQQLLTSVPNIELGAGLNGDRFISIDLIAHGTPHAVDFSARLARDAGANGLLSLLNGGAGGIRIATNGGDLILDPAGMIITNARGINTQRGPVRAGDVIASRGTSGYLFLNDAGTAYFFWNGADYLVRRDGVDNVLWHTGNDGAGSGLDADLLDGQQGAWYADIPARLGYRPVSPRTGNRFALGWNAEGQADRLYFNVDDQVNRGVLDTAKDLPVINSKLASADFTGANIRSRLVEVDGAGSGLDADLLDGQEGAFYTNIPARLGYTPVRNRTPGNAVWVGWDGNSGRTFYNVDDAVQRGYLDVNDLPRIDSKFQELRLTGNFSSGEAANFDAPSGGVITGYRRLAGTTGQVGQIVGKYLQGLSPTRGWVNAYNEG